MLREPPARRSALTRHPTGSAVAALTILAAALRLYRIGHQGLWFDEAYTVMLVKLPFAKLLSTVPKTESTPYLYYLLAWVWTHIFGRGASDLRALSALVGTAVVPIGYLATAKLTANRRAALIVAALATFNPLLIWYSQEARAYELLVLMSACTLLAFAYVREAPTRGRFAAWAVVCGLALATHYDAALVVVPEAIWLLVEYRHRLGAWLSVAFVAACGGGLLPLLIAQNNRHNTTWITKAPLNDRLGQILPQFFLGTGSHAYAALMWVAFVLGHRWTGAAGQAGQQHRTQPRAGDRGDRGRRLCARDDRGLGGQRHRADPQPARAVVAGRDRARLRPRGGARRPARNRDRRGDLRDRCHGDRQRRDRRRAAAPRLARGGARAGAVAGSAGQPPGATRLLVFQRNPWLESLTHVYMTDTRSVGRARPGARRQRDRCDRQQLAARLQPALALLVGRRLQPLSLTPAGELRDPRVPRGRDRCGSSSSRS